MARLNLSQNGNEELCRVFEEITGADSTKTFPDIGIEFNGDVHMLRWTGFQAITEAQAEQLIKAFQQFEELDLR
jgi:hypothetical protein